MRTETQERLSPAETIYSTYSTPTLSAEQLSQGQRYKTPKFMCFIFSQVRSQTEMSHAFHADNCQLKKNECDPSPPAYSYRDYSALLYLNRELSGGNLAFAERDKGTGRVEITDTVVVCGCLYIWAREHPWSKTNHHRRTMCSCHVVLFGQDIQGESS